MFNNDADWHPEPKLAGIYNRCAALYSFTSVTAIFTWVYGVMADQTGSDRIEIDFDAPLIAGEPVTVLFRYTVGATVLPEGARLRIGLPNISWARPEPAQYYFWSEYARGKDRTYTDYDRVNTTVTLHTQTEAVALLEAEARFRKPWAFPPNWLRDFDRWWITVTLEDAGLKPGDQIVVTYGDPDEKPLSASVQTFPEERVCFLAFIDAGGAGPFIEVPGSPWYAQVHGGGATRMDVIAPSIIRKSQTASIKIVYTDKVKARPEPAPRVETLTVGSDSNDDESRNVAVNQAADSLRIDVPELSATKDSAGALRVHVRDPNLQLEAQSNPTLVRDDGHQLFWGDLHGQSQYHGWNPGERVGISCGTPQQCHAYARDIAGLDFCAVTDTMSIAKDIWPDAVNAALAAAVPGRYVTFQGVELGDNVHGHRNVVFAADEAEPGIEAGRPNERGDGLVDMQTPSIQKRYTGRSDVLLIPHHVKMWLNWDCYDPALEPVMEIHSIWGSCEKAGTDGWAVLREMTGGAQEAWARGYKIGVIGGSDSHAGMPGRSLPCSDRMDFMPYKAGYAAVWAKELTRRSIFEAIKARRCYATTGERIIVETFIEGHPMGSEVAWPNRSRPCELHFNVWGTARLDSIAVVKNNEDVSVLSLDADHVRSKWTDAVAATAGDYYYLRVTQRDGNRAWTSPIWIV